MVKRISIIRLCLQYVELIFRRIAMCYYNYNFLYFIQPLEDHLMWLVGLRKSETSCKVSTEHRNSLDSFHQGSIHSLLVSLALVRNDGSFGCISSKELLLIGPSLTCKISIVERRNIYGWYINRSGCGNNVGWTDTTKRYSVYLVRSRNEDKSRLKNLKSYNALSTETSCEKNENSSRCDGGTNLRRISLVLAWWKRALDVISRVVLPSANSSSGLFGSASSSYLLCK